MNRIAPITAGLVLTALCVGVFWSGANQGVAGAVADDAINEKILKLAAAIKDKKGNVKQLAADLAKYDLEDVMHAYRTRSTGGLGVGRKPKTIIPDGIELKLLAMEKQPAPKDAPKGKEAEALDEMAYVIAAIAEVAYAKGPPGAKKKLKKDWDTYSKKSAELGLSLAEALKKGGEPVKDIATKINANCAACHSGFKGQ